MPSARTPSLPPAGAPSPFYRQHVSLDTPRIDGTMFMAAWRVRTHVDRLLRDGLITPCEWRIATAYRDMHERAFGSQIRTTRLDGIGGGHSYRAGLHPREALIDALRRLHDLHDRLDAHDALVLEIVVLADGRWCELAKRLGVHPKTARSRAIASIKALAVALR